MLIRTDATLAQLQDIVADLPEMPVPPTAPVNPRATASESTSDHIPAGARQGLLTWTQLHALLGMKQPTMRYWPSRLVGPIQVLVGKLLEPLISLRGAEYTDDHLRGFAHMMVLPKLLMPVQQSSFKASQRHKCTRSNLKLATEGYWELLYDKVSEHVHAANLLLTCLILITRSP